jgi:hypothetical protein
LAANRPVTDALVDPSCVTASCLGRSALSRTQGRTAPPGMSGALVELSEKTATDPASWSNQ